MQFVMLIYETADQLAARSDPARMQTHFGAWKAYSEALRKAGVIVGGNALQPPQTGATLRLKNGGRQVQDGPYADTKDQLGGFMVFEVPDLETALDWAARCPAANGGAVELRPVAPMG